MQKHASSSPFCTYPKEDATDDDLSNLYWKGESQSSNCGGCGRLLASGHRRRRQSICISIRQHTRHSRRALTAYPCFDSPLPQKNGFPPGPLGPDSRRKRRGAFPLAARANALVFPSDRVSRTPHRSSAGAGHRPRQNGQFAYGALIVWTSQR